MSPYADFPKNNRISMEWGRETIEMQENGSTKNLLQMTDIYYSVRRLIMHLLLFILFLDFSFLLKSSFLCGYN